MPEEEIIKLPGEGIYDNCILWEGSAFRQVKDFRDSDNFSSEICTPKWPALGWQVLITINDRMFL